MNKDDVNIGDVFWECDTCEIETIEELEGVTLDDLLERHMVVEVDGELCVVHPRGFSPTDSDTFIKAIKWCPSEHGWDTLGVTKADAIRAELRTVEERIVLDNALTARLREFLAKEEHHSQHPASDHGGRSGLG